MTVLVGITGSIGVLGIHAYLARLAAEPDVRIRAVMTTTAAAIVSPAALGALLRCPVVSDEWQREQAVPPSKHVEDVDVLLIAPATATTMSYCAAGAAPNLVSACYLAHEGPTIFAPAMAPEMLAHPATQRNLRVLAEDGAIVLETGRGLQVSSGRWVDGALCDYSVMRDAVFGAIERHSRRRVSYGID
jgi:phosphopantothenoylcysteine decarboxylase / phosphopantothenate---cysteine ligase